MKFINFLLVSGLSLIALTLAAGSPPAEAACSALPSTKGTVAMSLSVPSSGSYRVWARLLAPSTTVNGFYLQIADANACQITMGDAVIPVNAWAWVDYQNGVTTNKVNVTLTAGSHAVNLAGLDDGIQIDKILLLSDVSCTPAGDGSNCTSAAAGATPTPAATPIVVPVNTTPGKPTTVSNTITIPVPASITSAKCAVDGKTVDCSVVDTKKLSDGEHIVTVTGTDENGQPVQKSSTIEVKNNPTPAEQLIAGLQKSRWPLLALIIVLIGAPTGWVLVRHFGLMNRPHPAPGVPTMPPGPPPSNVVYPSAPDDKQ